MKIAITISTSVKPRRCRILEFYDAPAKSQSGTGTWVDLRNSCPRNTRNDTKIIKKRRSLLAAVAVPARHRFARSGLAELAPPNAQTCASKQEINGGRSSAMRLRRQNDFRTFAEKSAVTLHFFGALQKTSHGRRQRGWFWSSPCLPQTGLPFRVFRVLRGQKAAGNEPLKN